MTYKFGPSSQERVETLHPDLRRVVERAMSLQMMDFSVVCGARPIAEQNRLYQQGRTLPGPIVTNVDGINNSSKHNREPGKAEAVDQCPYPNMYNATEREWIELNMIMQIAAKLEGVKIVWGGDWKSIKDRPHWELA